MIKIEKVKGKNLLITMIGMKLHQSILMIVVSYDADTQDTLQYLFKFNKICHELFYS